MDKRERLANGETFTASEKGNSMRPLLENGEKHTLIPIKWTDVKVGDIVYCSVKGRKYTHLVKAIDEKRGCLITNNRGRVNGWTKAVYGKVIRKGYEEEE